MTKGSSAVRLYAEKATATARRPRKDTLRLPHRRGAVLTDKEIHRELKIEREILLLRNPLRNENSQCLMERLESPDERLRYLAAEALGGKGPKASCAVQLLISSLEDAARQVRYFSAQALGSIGAYGELSAPALVELFSTERDVRNDSPLVAAILSLSRIARHKPHLVLTLLWKEASDPLPNARIASAKCLYLIGLHAPHILEDSLRRAANSKLSTLRQTATVLQEALTNNSPR